MKQLHKKLKSRRGASLVFALLVVALCALAGIVALVAASSNMGRYTHLVQEERQYLSVASALDVLQGQLDAPDNQVKVTVDYTVKETWKYVDVGGTLELQKDPDPTYTLTLDNGQTQPAPAPTGDLTYFQKLLLLRCVPEEWFTSTESNLGGLKKPDLSATIWDSAGAKAYTVTLDATGTDWEGTLYPVTAKPKPANTGTPAPADLDTFKLEMALTAERKPLDVGSSSYSVKAVWGAEIDTKTDTAITTTGSPGVDEGTRTTTTTLTCTLRWSADNRTVTFG